MSAGGNKPANADYVCHCLRVTKDEVLHAIRKQGAKDVDDLNHLTGACGGCASCRWDLETLLRRELGPPHELNLAPAWGGFDTSTMLTHADARSLTASAGMTAADTVAVLELLMAGSLEPEAGAELLRSWAARGETGTELAATVRFLRSKARSVPVATPCFDVCGTGGSGLERFNVSTTVAFVAAAAGIPVAKHGNRGSRKPNGSFDLLDALEVPFELEPEQEAQLQADSGLCFIFARTHHPAVGAVVPYRKAAGGRSIFNLAGPLANPATVAKQIIGTIDAGTAQVVAAAITELKTAGALVVWGEPGIDEISVTGTTGYLAIAADGAITEGQLNQAPHAGLDYASLPHGDASDNALTFAAILDGRETGPLLDMVCANAGAAIDLWHGRAPALLGEGASQARELIASGAAKALFEMHREMARALG
ncbi:MAG: anthranilate phosphoribosyltransferase [Planctomycetota bacterium]|nr:anthranilate phosphoribosyltransferase [Planctomycetota bacterium]